MGIINQYHMQFIQSKPIHDFCREQKIAFSQYHVEDLVEHINGLVEKGEISREVIKEKLDEWIYQGRKKIVFKYLDSDILRSVRHYDNFKAFVEKNFDKSSEINSILELRADVDEKTHFIDIKYDYNPLNGKMSKAIFLFAKIVRYIKFEDGKGINGLIPIPVHVTIDFENNEIQARVSAKTYIYDLAGINKVSELGVAIGYLQKVLYNLGLNSYMDETDKDILKKAIYKTHERITKLPDEVEKDVDAIGDEIIEFIKVSANKLDIRLNNTSSIELANSIKNLFIKELIKKYSSKQKDLFTRDNFAYSTSITASGRSLSTLQHSSPSNVPIHSTPEYQNVRTVLDETEIIKKNTVHWKSIIKTNKFLRSKLFIDSKGYGIISFEEYVFEEDINHVFSKIRESKPPRIV